MRKLYSVQNKATKSIIKEDFSKDLGNSNYLKRLSRLFLIGILGLIIAIASGIYDIIFKSKWYNFMLDVSLLLSSLVFIFQSYNLKIKSINRYLINNKKKYKLIKSK